MTQTQKDFLMHLAIVVISAVLSFLLSYVKEFSAPVVRAGTAAIAANVLNGLKLICKV